MEDSFFENQKYLWPPYIDREQAKRDRKIAERDREVAQKDREEAIKDRIEAKRDGKKPNSENASGING